jgi:hypothetical protein
MGFWLATKRLSKGRSRWPKGMAYYGPFEIGSESPPDARGGVCALPAIIPIISHPKQEGRPTCVAWASILETHRSLAGEEEAAISSKLIRSGRSNRFATKLCFGSAGDAPGPGNTSRVPQIPSDSVRPSSLQVRSSLRGTIQESTLRAHFLSSSDAFGSSRIACCSLRQFSNSTSRCVRSAASRSRASLWALRNS